jgi:hypothetical protein
MPGSAVNQNRPEFSSERASELGGTPHQPGLADQHRLWGAKTPIGSPIWASGGAWDDGASCSWPLSTASSACSSMSSSSAATPRPACSRRYFFSAIRFASSSARPGVQDGSPLLLTAPSRRLPRPAWASLQVSPEAILRWHRELVRRKRAPFGRRPQEPGPQAGLAELPASTTTRRDRIAASGCGHRWVGRSLASRSAKSICRCRLGGLLHEYSRRAA